MTAAGLRHAPAGLLVLLVALAAGCASRSSAPVIDRLPPEGGGSAAATSAAAPTASPAKPGARPAAAPVRAVDAQAETYTVKRGDTLYSIALDHGQDYRELAQWNNLENPNVIRIGQVLRVRPPEEGGVQAHPVATAGSPVESRPLTAAPAAPPKPLPSASQTLRSEPRAVKLPYSEENLALLSRDPKPAAAPVAPRTDLALKPATELKPPAKPAAELPKPVAALPKPAAEAAKPAAEPPKPAAEPPKPAAPQVAKPEVDEDEAVDWSWPTVGRLLSGYTEGSNKGLDISGKSGQPVLASASGKVLYVGTMRGYGKLLVIRHNKAYSTVYAHNENILVKEGQQVTKGQKVAEMGNSDADQVKLHFEIRRFGKPIDPGKFLPTR